MLLYFVIRNTIFNKYYLNTNRNVIWDDNFSKIFSYIIIVDLKGENENILTKQSATRMEGSWDVFEQTYRGLPLMAAPSIVTVNPIFALYRSRGDAVIDSI